MIGSIVARSPGCAFAESSYIELELAITLFEKALIHPVIKTGLVRFFSFAFFLKVVNHF